MKAEMRHKLAQLPFEEKIRKVGELIRLSRKLLTQRVGEDSSNYPLSFALPPLNSKKGLHISAIRIRDRLVKW
jgi:hypothetical protein